MEINQLCALMDERQDELYQLLCELIRINSENCGPYGNEKECAEYIAKLCEELGMETEVYSPMDLEGFKDHPDYLDGRHLENRPNVTARWKGATDKDALMLMGHTDTVVIGDRSQWSFDPLAGEIRDGKIWGRGACDDKYALATALFLIRILKEQGFEPKENLLFSAYCDEEKGGSHGALASVLRYPCDRIVNMDCKNFEIWHSASGGLRYMGIKAGNNGADLGNGEILFVTYTDKTKEEIYAEYRELEKILDKRLAPLGIVGDGFFPATRFFHYAYCEPDCASIRDMQEAARMVSGRELKPCGSCLSDLSVILKYGSKEAYGFGIGRDFSKYGGAHQPDEFIECETLLEYAKIIAAYVVKTLG